MKSFSIWVGTVLFLCTVLHLIIVPYTKGMGFVPFMTIVLLVGYVATEAASRLITYVENKS